MNNSDPEPHAIILTPFVLFFIIISIILFFEWGYAWAGTRQRV